VLCPNCHRLAHEGAIDRKALRKYKEICKKLHDPPAKHEYEGIKAYLKFKPNEVAGILDAKNIVGLCDNGILDFSFHFDEPFEDESYVVGALGTGSVKFTVVQQTTTLLRIKIEEPHPEIVKFEFKY